MHRVIIPVDFSDTALNAARFVALMLAGKKDALAILYHNYKDPQDQEMCQNYLESLKMELHHKGDILVECVIEMGGDLIDNLSRLAQTRTATLIAMGITGRTAMGQKLIGSNTLKMVDRSLIPVMIIPSDASFNGIHNVAFASDFKDVVKSTPTAFINSVLEMFNPHLHIVNVDPNHYVTITEAVRMEKEKLEQMFISYKTSFYFLTMNNFFDAIDTFVRDYNIDMLVTVPRFHSNTTNLFKSTHTKRLAYHSNIPLMAAHE
ncbi:MAG TPA: universal stress protein [Chitinophagaceae bacterium]|nr:universal stress protein [Chitinophagaceae bacterium]